MTTRILIDIMPDGVQCYKCKYLGINGSQWWCRLYDDYIGFYAKEANRLERCLAAEAKLTALIGAGGECRRNTIAGTHPGIHSAQRSEQQQRRYDAAQAWDCAVEEVRK